MPLIEDAAREAFPRAQALRGLEPEFAIARGLCYALRIDRQTKGFHEAVEALIRSDDMEDLVLTRLPEGFSALTQPSAKLFSPSGIFPAKETSTRTAGGS